MTKYILISVVLFLLELLYFRVADRFNIIDKPNERSSHTRVVLRGGGIIFVLGLWVWSAFFGFHYPWLLTAVTMAAGVSFVDDIHSLPDSVRLMVQFVAMGLLLAQLTMDNGQLTMSWWEWTLAGIAALVVCVGATNVYNFMDGINGMTGGYSLAVLVPLLLANRQYHFIEESLLVVIALSVLVFCLFNFRTKAKCFAGDVGSVGIAFILLFYIGKLVVQTGDVTWLLFLIVYGVDGCLTILHRIMLRENLGQAHRKHAYQLMANELHLPHVAVSAFYAALQLAVSLVMVWAVPDTAAAHWMYFMAALTVLCLAYIGFMKKYYHLHEEYLVLIHNA